MSWLDKLMFWKQKSVPMSDVISVNSDNIVMLASLDDVNREFGLGNYNKNISEPVLSFVETFKANPKRFKVITLYKRTNPAQVFVNYCLQDKYNKLSWTFSVVVNYGFSISSEILEDYPSFLSRQEAEYIYKTMLPWFNSRKTLLKVREDNKQREALKKVYCK